MRQSERPDKIMKNIARGLIQCRTSPISREAAILALVLAALALTIAMWTQLKFTALPNLMPFTVGALVLDILCQFAAQTRTVRAVQSMLFGVLYLAITCFCGVLAAYATQRFSLPLQDQFFERTDLALGVNWFDVAHWVDDHPVIHEVLKLAYGTMSAQIALPVVVLAFLGNTDEVRKYLLSFVVALTVTIAISALLPAASPIALVDRTTFHVMQFTGATPVDHLMQLRSAGSLIINDRLGGIATFPSFHATIAVLTPLTLRRYRGIFLVLLMLDAAMLCGTITEGAHYVTDILGGSCVAFAAYLLANRVLGAKNHLSSGLLATYPVARDTAAAARAV
jgi:membrane-associated phospholipid phosphatase